MLPKQLAKKIFDHTKPLELIMLIARLCTRKDDIILDFFSGSATTAEAIMKLNCVAPDESRKFIMIQLPELCKEGTSAFKAGYRTICDIGMDRIKKARDLYSKEYIGTTADLGFKHYTLQEPTTTTLDKLEKFVLEEQGMFLTNDILTDFGTQTVLTTWLIRDGYGFNADVKAIDFEGYTGYYMDKHLYLIDADITKEAIAAIVDKYETDGSFNAENVVLFGYSFVWTMTEELKMNLARLKDTEKNLRINFDVRY